jgi:hypothetical protein
MPSTHPEPSCHPLAALALAALALVASSDAGAVTVTSLAGAPDPGPRPGEQRVVSFDAPPAPGFSWTGGLATATGTVRGLHSAPAGNTTVYGYVSSANADPYATLFTPALTSISFYWGSMDSHNWLWVLGADLQPIRFIHMSTIPFDRAAYAAGGGGRARRLLITANAGETIHGLRFWGRGRSFEFDDFAATLAPTLDTDGTGVPEPRSWAMLIAGFGLTGAIARRRRSGRPLIA